MEHGQENDLTMRALLLKSVDARFELPSLKAASWSRQSGMLQSFKTGTLRDNIVGTQEANLY